MIEINNNMSATGPGISTTVPRNKRFYPRKRNSIKCDICNVYLTSAKIMEVHLTGKKHNIIAKKLQENSWDYTCHICKIRTNGQIQLAEHISGKFHKARIEELQNFDAFQFYLLYTTVVTLLLFIFVYYILYLIFIFV